MNAEQILELTSELIAIPSVTGNELDVIQYVAKKLRSMGWNVGLMPVAENRMNIFVGFGKTPRVLFTTHLDVVPAPDALFTPMRDGDKLIGRGACDAKGIAATLVGTCATLQSQGESDFGLLLVVGEEDDGIGAKTAGKDLQGRGIEFIVNGEPTENTLGIANKGAVDFTITFKGRSCHSGYPELGDDANARAIRAASSLLSLDLGSDPVLGRGTMNLGKLNGGSARSVVSGEAQIGGCVRTVDKNEKAIGLLEQTANREGGKLEVSYICPRVTNVGLSGFQTSVMSYCTDIPFFAPLNAKTILYGPGSIHNAHTDQEFITKSNIEDGLQGYCQIFQQLKEVK